MFVAIGLATALCALAARYGRRALASYYLAVGVLYFIGLLWGYWTSPFTGPLYEAQVFTTVGRITVGLGLIGVAAVLQLGGLRTPREPKTSP